jgi:hypothetical protein
MNPHRSLLATPLAVAVPIVLGAWLLAACSDRAGAPADQLAPATPRSSQQELVAEEAEAGADKDLANTPQEPVRGLGYLVDDSHSYVGGKRDRTAKAKAPDAQALSELEKKTVQSLNQRANEAFEYLGARRQTREANGRADRLEELARYRDAPSAPLAMDEERVAGLAGSGSLALEVPGRISQAGEAPALSPAQLFERQRRSLENLSFETPAGYWANTYVPGDPVMRWLESRLEEGDRSALQAFAAQPLLLEAASHQTPQPFDPPSSAALSVFLQADRRGLDGESRILVQVGLQGAQRHSRLRPAMSVGIVFDLRGGVSTEVAAAMRALLDGFLEAKDVGDRFSVSAAGTSGGTLIRPDEFRHGPISLAMARLVEPGGAPRPGERPLGVEEAVRSAAGELRRGDDPEAPLGSSLVLLVTSQPFGPRVGALAALAHESAVAGVPVSVVGIGDRVPLDEVERVALAGQGNLRLLHAAAEAEDLVERELSALSRVIARALRLRVRLAPGVKLVSVVGSEPLDAAGAERVRQAEQSIDRRLARNLGIEPDRGEDEGGIQIVIPTFHSGDSHAVLLDLVAPGPGPVADVTVRYKDLVYLRNSVARTNLTLGRGDDPLGPLERNVVKNLLAIRLSETLKQAGRELMAGSDAQAVAAVRSFRELLASVQRELPGFQNDADLSEDTRMLGEYLAVLEAGALEQDVPRQYLADSLQLSGFFKTVPRSNAGIQLSRR